MTNSSAGPSASSPTNDRQDAFVQVGIAVALALVFAADVLTPAGVAVWIFYVVALVLSSFARQPRLPIAVGVTVTVGLMIGMVVSTKGIVPVWLMLLNRGFAVVVFWSISIVARQLVLSRLANERETWLQQARTRLLSDLQGAVNEEQIGERVLKRLAVELSAQAGVFYTREGELLRRAAGYAIEHEGAEQGALRLGQTLVGEVAKHGELRTIAGVPGTGLRIRSALVDLAPTEVVIAPCKVDHVVYGVFEIALRGASDPRAPLLLERSGEAIASAIRTAAHQRRLQEVLEETQRQAEELQVQQEELRVTNEELEVQSRALQDSAARLEGQQVELEGAHQELRLRSEKVEEHRNDLLQAQSELVKRSEELERASRYKSEFLANMSHELRTPLNSSLILAKLLAENRLGNLTPEQVRSAETIHAAGGDLLTLINEILDLSRIEAGHMEVQISEVSLADTAQTLRRFFRPVAEQKRLSFEVELAPDSPAAIPTDATRLQQILRNLLSNALKFTAQGGVVLRVQVRDERIEFVVSDSGEGIPENKLGVIFEAFRQADGTTQRRHGGTGLGLTISRQLAKLLGGDVQVASKVGEGSTFTLSLPRSLAQPIAAPHTALAAPARVHVPVPARRSAPPSAPSAPAVQVPDDREAIVAGSRCVLVVEDDVRFAEILRDLAREHGFASVVTTSANEAIDAASKYQPSAVVLDVHLPDGSGLWVLERLKSSPRTRHIPVHVVSGENYMQQALELGAAGYVLKPVDRDQLVTTFSQLQERLDKTLHNVLIVEDHPAQRESLVALLSTDNVEIVSVATGDEALNLLSTRTFDCMVLDLNLSDTSGFDLLDKMAAGASFSFPPVIVYTGREVSRDEELRLRRYASSIIIKGARSPERLLDEVTLFLHKVEAELPPPSQQLLRGVRDRELLLDGKRVLLAEDDVRNVFALTSYLEPKGVQLRIARNGREAINVLEGSREDPERRIELVLMDVMMPEMDGLSAMREIRSKSYFAKLPIIALTAKAMPDDRDKCLKAGANDYISKPLDLDKLTSLIKVWIPK